jgi:ParB family chromosome partitioning protein
MIPKQKIPTLQEALSGTMYGSERPDEKRIVMLDPSELTEIEDQPFRPYSSERLQELAEDIKTNGQINPCTIRKKDGQLIILAGRNRKRACEMAGLKVACVIVECDDPTGNLILVNSNLNQRQELLPSEKALAYKLQKESYEAKGQKKTAAAVAEQNSENVKMIQRYIKLTNLSKELMDMVDAGRLPVMVGVELSNMTPDDMVIIFMYLREHQNLPVSVEQAKELRPLSPITETELNHFFYPNEVDIEKITDSKSKADKRNKTAEISVSLKVSALEDIDRSIFDYKHASKDEIKEHVLDCLGSYSERNVSMFIRRLSCLAKTGNGLGEDTVEKIEELAEQEGYA